MLDESGDKYWVFDTLAKKPLVTRLFAAMSGSVVTQSGKDGAVAVSSNGRGKKAKDKENIEPDVGDTNKGRGGARRATAKGKAAGRGRGGTNSRATSNGGFSFNNVPEEKCLSDTTISCSLGVRPKLWIDDLLACVNHVVTSVKAMGLQHEVNFIELKGDLISIGLRFAFLQEVILNNGQTTKQHKRWSTLRPALKQYALHKILQDWLCFCVCFCLFVWLFGCLVVWLFVWLFVCLFVCWFVCLFVVLFVELLLCYVMFDCFPSWFSTIIN